MDVFYSHPIPASAPNGFLNSQESARRHRANERNNSARWAVTEHQVHTIGTGNFRAPQPIVFDVKFLQEPQFSSGVALVKHPGFRTWFDPAGDALVRSWVRDDRGSYTGARISYRVEIDRNGAPETEADPNVELVHFLTFSGLAYKSIDGVDLDDMTPHTVQF